MALRTKGEQKAYLDGYEMCGECIEKYLSAEGKQKLKCLVSAVRNAVEIEDLPTGSDNKGEWITNSDYPDTLICDKCGARFDMWHYEKAQMHFCPSCGACMNEETEKELEKITDMMIDMIKDM